MSLRNKSNLKVTVGLLATGSLLLFPHAAAAQLETFQTILTFPDSGVDGTNPQAGLTLENGILYGTTSSQGSNSSGTVFEINASTLELTQDIPLPSDSQNPASSLVPYGSNFLGTAEGNSRPYDGSIFELDTSNQTVSTLYTFTSNTGTAPLSELTPGPNGTYYGTTSEDGAHGNGTIFQYDPSNNSVTTVASFTGGSGADPGSYPLGGVLDANGTLYGTTNSGGSSEQDGNVFSLDGTTFTVLETFNGANGAFPVGTLAEFDGNYYGVTQGEAETATNGSIFEINGTTGAFTNLATMPTTGEGPNYPSGGLTYYNGLFYGVTEYGGSTTTAQDPGQGAIYTFDPITDQISTLFSFTGDDGADPVGTLVTDGSGNFYGTTYATTLEDGSQAGDGTVFEFSVPATVTPEPSPCTAFSVAGLLLTSLVLVRRRKMSAE